MSEVTGMVSKLIKQEEELSKKKGLWDKIKNKVTGVKI